MLGVFAAPLGIQEPAPHLSRTIFPSVKNSKLRSELNKAKIIIYVVKL